MQLLGIELHLWPRTTVARSEEIERHKNCSRAAVILTSIEAAHGVRGKESSPGGPADGREPGEEMWLELGHNGGAAPGGLVGRAAPAGYRGDQTVIAAPATTASTASIAATLVQVLWGGVGQLASSDDPLRGDTPGAPGVPRLPATLERPAPGPGTECGETAGRPLFDVEIFYGDDEIIRLLSNPGWGKVKLLLVGCKEIIISNILPVIDSWINI